MKVLVVGLRREHSRKLRQLYQEMQIDVLDDQSIHHKPVRNAHEYDLIVSLTNSLIIPPILIIRNILVIV